MEEATRRYIRRILITHLLLLVTVIAVLFIGVRLQYLSARTRAIEQAKQGQALLARQTALGIQNYYESVTNVLDLLQPGGAEGSPTSGPSHVRDGPPRPQPRPSSEPLVGMRRAARDNMVNTLFAGLGQRIWGAIKDKSQTLFLYDPDDDVEPVVQIGGDPETLAIAREVARSQADFLKSVRRRGAVSGYIDAAGGGHALVVPFRAPSLMKLVAFLPIAKLEQQMLSGLNRTNNADVMLVDEREVLISGTMKEMVGRRISDLRDSRARDLAKNFISKGIAGTEVYLTPDVTNREQFVPAMITVQPIEVLGQRWSVLIASALGEIDQLMTPIFRDATLWAGVIMLAMTCILVSTAWQTIRARVKLERARMEIVNKELSQARRIQMSWLPEQPCTMNGIRLAAVNKPASHVSGDFYNWFELPNGKVVVLIGDVTGHGMSAAFLMSTTQLLVKVVMQRVEDPGQCLEQVNRLLCAQSFSGQFVTMLVMVIDMKRRVAEVATAGHQPPLVGNGRTFSRMEVESELVLGVDRNHGYPTTVVPLPKEASILLYTDGVPEAAEPAGSRFGEDALVACLTGCGHEPDRIIQQVLGAVDEFRTGRELADDVTLVALQLRA